MDIFTKITFLLAGLLFMGIGIFLLILALQTSSFF